MSWQDILKIEVNAEELRQVVSPEVFERLTQEETSDENLPQKITEDMDEDTQKKIRSAERKEQSTMSRKEIADAARARLTEDKESKKKPGRIAEPKPTFRERMATRRKEAQTPEATKERMARRKELAGKAGRALFSRKPYTKPAKEILGRAKRGVEQTLQESTERRRKKIADRREAERKEKEEWEKTRDMRQFEFDRQKGLEQIEREKRQEEKAGKKRDKQLAREQKRALQQMASQAGVGARGIGETDEAYLQRIKQGYQKKQTQQKTPKGPTGPPPSTTSTGKEQGQISSTPSEKGLEAQKRLNEQTEQTTQALENATNKLNKSVIKMNNDKYNTEQKSEPNRNFTPFVPLKKKRVMPEKQNKIPGVIQHSRPKRKKTENKW